MIGKKKSARAAAGLVRAGGGSCGACQRTVLLSRSETVVSSS
jgi:hypothetical protein